MGQTMSRSPLDPGGTGDAALARFRRMMRGWALAAVLIAAASLGWFWYSVGLVSIHFYIAAALGIGLMTMLTGALMSLLFLSSGSGHDEAVRDWEKDEG